MSTPTYADNLDKLLYKPPSGIHWADVVDSDDMYDVIPALAEDLGAHPDQKDTYTLEDALDAVEIIVSGQTQIVPAGSALDPSILLQGSNQSEWPEDCFARFRAEAASSAAPDAVQWWPTVNIPKTTTLILGDPDLYSQLCDFCRTLQNCEVDAKGRIARTLCDSCRMIVSRHELNHCRGGTERCETYRFVDAVGGVATLCRGCYQHDEWQRRQRRGAAPRQDRRRAVTVRG